MASKKGAENAARAGGNIAGISLLLGLVSIILIIPSGLGVAAIQWPFWAWTAAFGLPALAGVALGIAAIWRRARKGTSASGKLAVPIAGTSVSLIVAALASLLLVDYFNSTESITVNRKVYAPIYRSDLGVPVSSGATQPLRDIGKIYVKGSTIFVNEQNKGIHVIDNRDPSHPVMTAFLEIPGNVDLAVRDDILYADSATDLVAIDISDCTGAREIHRIGDVFPVIDKQAIGGVPGIDVRFQRIDKRRGPVVSWRCVGEETHTYRGIPPIHGGGCFPRGTQVLTALGPRAIETVVPGIEVAVCDPASGAWTLAPVSGVRESRYSGDIVVIGIGPLELEATGNHPFRVLRGTDLDSRPHPRDVPEAEPRSSSPGRWVEARDLQVGDLLAARSRGEVTVTALSSRRGQIEAFNLEVDGSDTYAVLPIGILVHNKGQTERVAASPSTGRGGSLARFAIVGNHLYALSGSKLQLFDIEDPAALKARATVDIGWDIETLFPYRDALFIGGRQGMYIYDNRDPANPVRVARFAHVTTCDPVVVEGDTAYVTLRGGTRCGGRANRLDIIDISSLANPRLAAQYPMQGPYGLGIESGILLVCDGTAGLKVFDASDPLKLRLLQTVRGCSPIDVILHEQKGIVAAREGLYQYDCRDAAALRLISRIPVVGTDKP
jgi:hypothetical protein